MCFASIFMDYLLIGHYEPLNFLLRKSALSSPLKKLAVSSAKYQCLVLLASIFSQKCLLSLFHGLFTCCSGIMNPWIFWSWKVLPTLYQKNYFLLVYCINVWFYCHPIFAKNSLILTKIIFGIFGCLENKNNSREKNCE